MPILPKTGVGLATFYNAIYAERGITLPPHLYDPCKALMDERIKKLCIILGPGGGKSALISTVFPAFMVGQDPTMTCLGVSAGEALVQGFVHAAMEWVEFSPVWKNLFPNVNPDKTAGWSKEAGMFVSGRKPGNPDASYIGVGITSKRLTGLHAKLNIWDDLHDKENATSEESCGKIIASMYSTLYGRGDPGGARYFCVGRRWHQADVYAHIKEQGDWVVMELQALRSGTELYWDVFIPDGVICSLNEPPKIDSPGIIL